MTKNAQLRKEQEHPDKVTGKKRQIGYEIINPYYHDEDQDELIEVIEIGNKKAKILIERNKLYKETTITMEQGQEYFGDMFQMALESYKKDQLQKKKFEKKTKPVTSTSKLTATLEKVAIFPKTFFVAHNERNDITQECLAPLIRGTDAEAKIDMFGVNFGIEHKGIHVATIMCNKLEELDMIYDRIKRRTDFYAFAFSSNLSVFPEPITGWIKLQEKHDRNIEEEIFEQLKREVKVISVTYFQSKSKVKIMVRDKEEMDKLTQMRIKIGEDTMVVDKNDKPILPPNVLVMSLPPDYNISKNFQEILKRYPNTTFQKFTEKGAFFAPDTFAESMKTVSNVPKEILDLGISINWHGIPTETTQRTIEKGAKTVVKSQAKVQETMLGTIHRMDEQERQLNTLTQTLAALTLMIKDDQESKKKEKDFQKKLMFINSKLRSQELTFTERESLERRRNELEMEYIFADSKITNTMLDCDENTLELELNPPNTTNQQ